MIPEYLESFYRMHPFQCPACSQAAQIPLLSYLRWYKQFGDEPKCYKCEIGKVAEEFQAFQEKLGF